ncbi:MAG: hypothetical protein U9R42_04275, partial [Bacteroidota bacterium]|nr:hypothetical protein [Bacteroidota bacterium]
MKKNKTLFLSLIFSFIIGIIFWGFIKNNNKTTFYKATETDVIGNEDESNHIKRQKWIDEMHKSAKGTNWKKIELSNRIKRANKYRNYYRNNFSERTNIATGKLIGHWKETGSNNQAGRIHLSEIDTLSKKLYCASAGGNIWKTKKGEDNWSVINDQFKIPKIIALKVSYSQSLRRIFVVSGSFSIEGFFYTDNEGQSWNIASGLENIAKWGVIKRAIFTTDSTNSIYLLAKEWDYTNWDPMTSVYRSTDFGISFTQIASFDKATYGDVNKFDIWADKYNSDKVYLLENNNIHSFDKSNNLNFISSFTINNSGSKILKGCKTKNSTTLYVSVSANNESKIYRSMDEGNNWAFQGTVNTDPFTSNSFCVSSTNPDNLYFGGVNCFKSYDGGASWTLINEWYKYYNSVENKLHADIPGINIFKTSATQEKVYISTDGGLFLSQDSMQTVENVSLKNHRVSQYYSTYTCRFSPEIVHAGSQDQGYQLSKEIDGKFRDFEQVVSGDYGHIVSGDEGASVWMVYPGFAIYYPNINDNTSRKKWDFNMTGQYWMPPLMEDPEDNESVYLAGGSTTGGAHIFHLTYQISHINFNELSFDFSNANNSKISAMAYSPLDKNTRYVLTNNGEFFVSQNGGANWTLSSAIKDFGAHYFYGADIIASQKDSSTVYIAGSGYSNYAAFVSYDKGKTFDSLGTALPSTLVYAITATEDEKYIFAATE